MVAKMTVFFLLVLILSFILLYTGRTIDKSSELNKEEVDSLIKNFEDKINNLQQNATDKTNEYTEKLKFYTEELNKLSRLKKRFENEKPI